MACRDWKSDLLGSAEVCQVNRQTHLCRPVESGATWQTAAWLLRNHIDVSDFSLLVHDSVLAEDFLPAARAAFIRQLPATLRLLELYEYVAAIE